MVRTVAGIFLAIPIVAILTVSYRHWLEHRGSEGLADVLEPTPVEATPPKVDDLTTGAEPAPRSHPDLETTPADMVRARPDLTTGELKMPVED